MPPLRNHVFMWFADVYCDFDWVSSRKGVLGPKRFALRGGKSVSLGIEIDLHFFGDDQNIRHVRILMHTDDQKTANECVDLNVQTWVASLESAVMMETGQPFHVAAIAGSQTFAIALGFGDENSPAVTINPIQPAALRVDYARIAVAMTAWSPDLTQHLFYFRRLVDMSLPLDVRWLNGYRLLEWEFLRGESGLARDSGWRDFVEEFDSMLEPYKRPNQSSVGCLEEARALAAHAGRDDRSDEERARDRRNAMEKTLHVLECMAMKILNGHFSTTCHRGQLQVRS